MENEQPRRPVRPYALISAPLGEVMVIIYSGYLINCIFSLMVRER